MNVAPPPLTRIRQALADFVALLEEETLALAAQDLETLAVLTQRRETVHQHVEQAWKELLTLARAPAGSALGTLSEQIFRGSPATPEWQQVEQLAQSADRLNRINVRLLDEQTRRTQAALQILRQSQIRRDTYGSDGRLAESFNTQRPIDLA